MDTFVDNVLNLAVEQCLIDNLTGILTPEKVNRMSDEKLDKLGSESPDIKSRRKHLLSRQLELKKLQELCEQSLAHVPAHCKHQNHSSSKKGC